MPEKPILFSTAMVQAILGGRKTMTRRLVKYHGRTPMDHNRQLFYKVVDELNGKKGPHAGFYKDSDVFDYEGKQLIDAVYFRCPYGQPGDILWVRETWQESECFDFNVKDKYAYLANEHESEFAQEYKIRWRPSIHMPKKAARLFLRVKNVRVERVQDISIEDARAEGITEYIHQFSDNFTEAENDVWRNRTTIENFAALWDSIYAKRGHGWDVNPWVVVVEFEVMP